MDEVPQTPTPRGGRHHGHPHRDQDRPKPESALGDSAIPTAKRRAREVRKRGRLQQPPHGRGSKKLGSDAHDASKYSRQLA